MRQLPLDIGLTEHPRLHNFVPGANALALAHLQTHCAHLPHDGTPTYLWGSDGSGKSHLLQAVMQELQEQGLPVGWLDSHTSCGSAALPFDTRWQAVCMDDVHAYSAAQQHTAFNWFVNALTPLEGTPRWVLAAGNLPVADLPLREDLRTRLGWGQVFALQALDDAGARVALQQAARARGLELGDDVLRYMQSRFSRDMGSLHELLDMLDRYALETRRAITIPLLKQMLHDN